MPRGDYSGDWPETSLRVKTEAHWRCVRCGHEHCKDTGHVLTVHHFDGDKSNNADWNLMPLCQRCHLSVQGRVDPSQGIMVQPSLWSLPYIAGMFMAGKTPEPSTWNLEAWIKDYEKSGRSWPWWAPTP